MYINKPLKLLDHLNFRKMKFHPSRVIFHFNEVKLDYNLPLKTMILFHLKINL